MSSVEPLITVDHRAVGVRRDTHAKEIQTIAAISEKPRSST